MTHLRIELGSTIETVSDSVIKKLYDTALSISEPQSGEEDDAYMSGHISVPHTYESYVEYLAGSIGEGTSGVVTNLRQNSDGRFQDLRIDVTNDYYLPFTDAEVGRVLATNFGDGVGITRTQAAARTSLNYVFQNNANVVNVDLSEFTNLQQLSWNGPYYNRVGEFQNCTQLKTLILPPSCKTVTGGFVGCTNLEYVTVEHILTLQGRLFLGCTKLFNNGVANFKSFINWDTDYMYDQNVFFSQCSFKQIYLPRILSSSAGCFFSTWSWGSGFFGRGANDGIKLFLCNLIYLKDLSKIYCGTFSCLTGDCVAIVINNTTPPTWANTGDKSDSDAADYEKASLHMFDWWVNNRLQTAVPNVYVPDSAVSTYQNHAMWGTKCSIYGISNLNSGVIYSTEADWELAGKPNGLIAEYLDLTLAELTQFITDNSLTVYTPS